MQGHGWSIGHPRWLGVKLLLVAFLVVPLEALHAWASHVWIARGLSQAGAAGELRRGLAMEAMVRTLEAVLLSLALPLQVWLSRARPF
jgi:hypothetical protein